jgi:hypothetical protein
MIMFCRGVKPFESKVRIYRKVIKEKQNRRVAPRQGVILFVRPATKRMQKMLALAENINVRI